MENEKLKECILKTYTRCGNRDRQTISNVSVQNEQVVKLAEFLKNSEETAFDYLFCESAVDYQRSFSDGLSSRFNYAPSSDGHENQNY